MPAHQSDTPLVKLQTASNRRVTHQPLLSASLAHSFRVCNRVSPTCLCWPSWVVGAINLIGRPLWPDALGGCNLNVNGGEFTCASTSNGGFLYASDGSRVTINGGLIANNVATKRGAGVSGTLALEKGCRIDEDKSSTDSVYRACSHHS